MGQPCPHRPSVSLQHRPIAVSSNPTQGYGSSETWRLGSSSHAWATAPARGHVLYAPLNLVGGGGAPGAEGPGWGGPEGKEARVWGGRGGER